MNPFKKIVAKEATASVAAPAVHPLLAQAQAEQTGLADAATAADRRADLARESRDKVRERLSVVDARRTADESTIARTLASLREAGAAAAREGDDEAASLKFQQAVAIEHAPASSARADEMLSQSLQSALGEAQAAFDQAEAAAADARGQLELCEDEMRKLVADIHFEAGFEALKIVDGKLRLNGLGIPLGLSRSFRAANGMDRLEFIDQLQLDVRSGRYAAAAATRPIILNDDSPEDLARAAAGSKLRAEQRGSSVPQANARDDLIAANRARDRV